MPEILFKLRNVPDDEANEVRELLDEHKIDYYETPAGRWGVSMEAIWLKEDSRLEEAKHLIDEYQKERCQRVRQEYEELKQQGKVESILQRLIKRPIGSLAYIGFILIILYFVTMPFIKMASN